ncbi:MAG: cytochrome c [Gemmatimonadaceae bacterium]
MLRTCALAVAVVCLPGVGKAQDSTNGSRSTLEGVYTREQANRGRDVYAGMCQSCHALASHTGVVFNNTWAGKPLSDLFAFVSEKMPKNEPGSLTREEYAQVIAHILRLNGMPPGFDELPTDSLALHQIRIDVKKP